MTGQGLSILHRQGTTRLKWHRMRRRPDDIPFTLDRLLEGLALGASMEVDLRCHAGSGFAVLHDETLDRETTGTGDVASSSPDELHKLSLRDGDGRASDQPLLLLEDIATLIARKGNSFGGLIQLDLKEAASAIRDETIGNFERVVSGAASSFILSGGDAEAVARLSSRIPELRTGYDPCRDESIEKLRQSLDFEGFVADTLQASPSAAIIYLDYRLVLAALDLGADLVALFRDAGKPVDAWTLNPDHPRAAESLARLLDTGVYQITTDDPIRMEEISLRLSVQ